MQEDVCFNKNSSLWHSPISHSSDHTRSLLHYSSSTLICLDTTACCCQGSPCKGEKNHRAFILLALRFLSLVLLGCFLYLLLCSLRADTLRQLLGLPDVLFGHPDYRLPSGMALLQLLESLGHLGKRKLGLHNWQDLWWYSKKKYQKCELKKKEKTRETIKRSTMMLRISERELILSGFGLCCSGLRKWMSAMLH